MKKLAGVEAPLANFFASGVLALGAEARPAAVAAAAQPRLRPGPAGALLRAAAPDHRRRRGPGHPARRSGWTAAACSPPTRTARCGTRWRSGTAPSRPRPSSSCCRAHDVALVVADTAGKWPKLARRQRPTSSTCACTASEELYVSGYDHAGAGHLGGPDPQLADRRHPDDGRTLAPPAPPQPRDVYVYFDNDVKVRAPFDAHRAGRSARRPGTGAGLGAGLGAACAAGIPSPRATTR